jgi:hypothetical protein
MTEIGVGLAVPEDLNDADADGSCGVPALFREMRVAPWTTEKTIS